MLRIWAVLLAVSVMWTLGIAAYKARPWKPRPRESYPAQQASQGLVVAVDPLFRDPLAEQVFDKDDIVSRGIMPLAVIVFNDNDFPVEINAATIELIIGEDHSRTMEPERVVPILFKQTGNRSYIPIPIPRGVSGGNPIDEPLEDFDHKFLSDKTIGAKSTAGGFLYFKVPQTKTLVAVLAKARIYIPEIIRQDNGSRLMYFEIDLKPAIEAVPVK